MSFSAHSDTPPSSLPITNPPSYLSILSSSHQWYDYSPSNLTSSFNTAADDQDCKSDYHHHSLPTIKKRHLFSRKGALTPSDILTLATLVPSTRSLLANSQFLQTLELTSGEREELRTQLKAKSGEGKKRKGIYDEYHQQQKPQRRKTKLEELRDEELKLQEGEKKAADREKRNFAKRSVKAGRIRKGSGDGDTNPGRVQEGNGAGDNNREVILDGRKKQRISELDHFLNLGQDTVGGNDKAAKSREQRMAEIDSALSNQAMGGQQEEPEYDTNHRLAQRKAALDMLLGLVKGHGYDDDEAGVDAVEEQPDLSNEDIGNGISHGPTQELDKLKLRRMKIDMELSGLPSGKRAEVDEILVLMSPERSRSTD